MLNIRFGTLPNMITKINGAFRSESENEWFSDPMVREMVLDIDKSEIVMGRFIESPVLGTISPNELSGGVKILIMALFAPQYVYVGSSCGDNCNKWFLKVADRLEAEGRGDLKLCYYHIPDYKEPFRIRIDNSGNIVSAGMDFFDEYFNAKEVMYDEWDVHSSKVI